MNTSLPKPFTVKIGALTCNVSFSLAPVMITTTEPRNIITCHITTKGPMAHYAGDCVKHPQDTDADILYPFAKVAMKRAVEAMIGGLVIRGDLCPNCLDLKAIYSEFREAMRDTHIESAKIEQAQRTNFVMYGIEWIES